MGRPSTAATDRALLGKVRGLLVEALQRRGETGPEALADWTDSFDVEDALAKRAFDLLVAETAARRPRTSRKRPRGDSDSPVDEVDIGDGPIAHADARHPTLAPSRRRDPVLVGGPSSWAALAAPTELALPSGLPPPPLSARDEIDIEALRDGWALVNSRRPHRRSNLGSVARSSTQRATLRSSDRRAFASSSGVPYVPLATLDSPETTDQEELAHRSRHYRVPPAEYVDMSDFEEGDFGESGGLARYVDRFAHDRAAELERPPTPPPVQGMSHELVAAAHEASAAMAAGEQRLLSLRDFLDAGN